MNIRQCEIGEAFEYLCHLRPLQMDYKPSFRIEAMINIGNTMEVKATNS